MYEKIADMGIVSIQAHTIFLATPHRTADNLDVAPTPIIDPDIACVVLTGKPITADPARTKDPPVSAQKP